MWGLGIDIVKTAIDLHQMQEVNITLVDDHNQFPNTTSTNYYDEKMDLP